MKHRIPSDPSAGGQASCGRPVAPLLDSRPVYIEENWAWSEEIPAAMAGWVTFESPKEVQSN